MAGKLGGNSTWASSPGFSTACCDQAKMISQLLSCSTTLLGRSVWLVSQSFQKKSPRRKGTNLASRTRENLAEWTSHKTAGSKTNNNSKRKSLQEEAKEKEPHKEKGKPTSLYLSNKEVRGSNSFPTRPRELAEKSLKKEKGGTKSRTQGPELAQTSFTRKRGKANRPPPASRRSLQTRKAPCGATTAERGATMPKLAGGTATSKHTSPHRQLREEQTRRKSLSRVKGTNLSLRGWLPTRNSWAALRRTFAWARKIPCQCWFAVIKLPARQIGAHKWTTVHKRALLVIKSLA